MKIYEYFEYMTVKERDEAFIKGQSNLKKINDLAKISKKNISNEIKIPEYIFKYFEQFFWDFDTKMTPKDCLKIIKSNYSNFIYNSIPDDGKMYRVIMNNDGVYYALKSDVDLIHEDMVATLIAIKNLWSEYEYPLYWYKDINSLKYFIALYVGNNKIDISASYVNRNKIKYSDSFNNHYMSLFEKIFPKFKIINY